MTKLRKAPRPTAEGICRRRWCGNRRSELGSHDAVALFQAFDHFGHDPVADSGLDLPRLWATRPSWQKIDRALSILLRSTSRRTQTPPAACCRFSGLHRRGVRRTIAQGSVFYLKSIGLVRNDN